MACAVREGMKKIAALIWSIGNLALVEKSLNASLSNDQWSYKPRRFRSAKENPVLQPVSCTILLTAFFENVVSPRPLTAALMIGPPKDT